MLFRDITILDRNLDVLEHRYVGIKDGKIDYIGTEAPQDPKRYGEAYNGKNRLLMSGFFNAHAHTPMVLMRGYGENMRLQSWLNDRIFPYEEKITGEDVYWGSLYQLAEGLRFGVVSNTDMYYFGGNMAQAAADSGVKSNLSVSITCFGDEDLKQLELFKEAQKVFSDWNGAEEGRIRVDMSLHAEYTSTPKVVRQLADFTKEIGAGMHVHVAETETEVADCARRHDGKTPVEYFNELGLFDSPTTAAHCVWLSEGDFDILKDKNVTAASCPISNLKLASGICDASRMLEKGINVAVGTDSTASNNSLNFIEEIKFFSLLHKYAKGDPTLITPKEALYAATAAGAKSQGRGNTGVLEVGKQADLIVLDLSGPQMKPVHDLLNNLVYSASGSDVVLTMVDGRVLYREGEFPSIDMERAEWQVERSNQRILKEL